jgi:hypothetical protein
MISKNIRLDLDPARVAATIERQVASIQRQKEVDYNRTLKAIEDYELDEKRGRAHRWTKKPEMRDPFDTYYERRAEVEKVHYALVRVIDVGGAGKFILVYGDTDDETVERGTGPFESFEKAADWFYKCGR